MSAQTRQPDAPDGDDAPPDIDAYAIEIPESFVAAYPEAETVQEALRLAEAAPPADTGGEEHEYQDLTDLDATTTHTTAGGDQDAPTCVRCGGRRLSPKGNGTQRQKKTEGYVCETCRTHCSDPDNPELADIEFGDDQVQLGRFADE